MMVSGDSPLSFGTASEVETVLTVERHFPAAARRGRSVGAVKYYEKFGVMPAGRPFYAVLGAFDRTLSMYRDGRSLRLDMSRFARDQVTFMYPDHFVLIWSKGLYPPPPALFGSSTYSYELVS
jgi:hypothetical protein